MRSIRVLLVDDQRLVACALRALLAAEPGFEVVGMATEGKAAVEAAGRHKPTIILMETVLAGMNGIDATRRILKKRPRQRILCLSTSATGHLVEAALCAGAAGYLLKGCTPDELFRALRTVAAGEIYLTPRIGHAIVERLRSRNGGGSAFQALSPREREVLQLLAEGWTTKEIAARLHLTGRTVGSHRERLMEKLGIRGIAGLTRYAIAEGLTAVEGRPGP